MSEAPAVTRIFIKDEDAIDLPYKQFQYILDKMLVYRETKLDEVLLLETIEGARAALAVSQITGLYSFTPVTRRRYQELRYAIAREIEEYQLELGGPEWVERCRE